MAFQYHDLIEFVWEKLSFTFLHTNFKTILIWSVVPVFYDKNFNELCLFLLEVKAFCEYSYGVFSLDLFIIVGGYIKYHDVET